MKHGLRVMLAAVVALAGLGQYAAAEISAGQHVIIAGIGGGIPTGDINVVHKTDIDEANGNDLLTINKRAGASGLSGFAQYTYHVWPFLGFGIDIQATGFGKRKNDVSLEGRVPNGSAAFGAGAGGTFTSEATLVQYLAIARWVIMPEKNINPYLLGGIGFNSFNASVRFDPNANAASLWNDGTHNERQLYTRSSAGFGSSLGGGVQAQAMDSLLLGIEGRWNYSGVDSSDFGTKSVNSGGGYFWAGWKF